MPNKQVTYVLNLRDKFSTRLSTANKSTQRFDKSIGRLIGRFAAFSAVSGVLISSIKKIADFEEAVSNLSAITGATGEDLDFLSRKAIELGKATTKSSIDTVKAFKLIASAKPELLDNARALAETTKQAIILSEASGLDLPSAATALASALNQFGLSADQSARAINVLASGSKFASAEIPDLTASLKEFGGIADSLDIPLEQAAAAVETISSKELKGSRAGIQLKNVFLRLGKSADKNLNPKIVGLSKALENLAPIQDDVNALTKLFGTESVIAGQTLIKQRGRLDELTEAMTGTNIAYEQARINTDNLNSDVKRLSSAWEGFILNLNQGEGQISRVFRTTTQGLTLLIEKFDQLNKTQEEKDRSASERVREKVAASLAGIKDEEKAKEAIIDRIQLERKFRGEEAQELKEINKIRASGVGSLVFGGADLFRKNLLTQFVSDRTAAVKSLTELIEDPLAFDKFFKSFQSGSIIEDDDPLGLGLGGADSVTKITAGAPKVLNINIQQMTGIGTLNTNTFEQGTEEAGNSVLEQLQIAITDAQAIS